MDSAGQETIRPEHILIIKLSALGDVVQALPVLSAVKKCWPTTRVDWITAEVGAGLLNGHPLLDRVIIYPRKRLGRLAANPLSWPMLVKEILELSSGLKTGCYDMALDLQGLFKSGLITLLSGARQRVGFAGGREASSLFLNRKLPKYDLDQHAVLRYLKAAAYLGVDVEEVEFDLGLSEKDLDEARYFIRARGLAPRGFVLLIPGTIWQTKRWSLEGFSSVSRLIDKRFGLKSLVVGSNSDSGLAEEIVRRSRGSALDITGKTPLRLLASLCSFAATAVTTDTGPMHLAAAAGLRVIAIFGPTAPWRTGPFGKGHVIVRKGLSCSPCFKRRCPTTKCMASVTAEEVLAGVEKILSS